MRAAKMLLTLLLAVVVGVAEAAGSRPPEFNRTQPADWINSEPLTLAALRGKVVLVEFWTFGCVNCQRTLPWLKAMHERYADRGLAIVSVHTPEFEHERDPTRVRDAVRRHAIDYPVMLDDDSSYWNAFGNRFWPAFYLVGPSGLIEASAFGELHQGTARGDEFEQRIRRLLPEELTRR
jgi:thiol-disulfide isomerase/thioredoxin